MCKLIHGRIDSNTAFSSVIYEMDSQGTQLKWLVHLDVMQNFSSSYLWQCHLAGQTLTVRVVRSVRVVGAVILIS